MSVGDRHTVVFIKSKGYKKDPFAKIGTKYAFVHTASTLRPKPGDICEVSIGLEPQYKNHVFVYVDKLLTKCNLGKIILSKGEMQMINIIVDHTGKLHLYKGKNIPGILEIAESCDIDITVKTSKNTKILNIPGDEENYFSEFLYWEDIIRFFQNKAIHVQTFEIRKFVKHYWPKVALELDKRENFYEKFSQNIKAVDWIAEFKCYHDESKDKVLIIDPDGYAYNFFGENISDVVQIIKEEKEYNGKYSITRYYCISPFGTTTYTIPPAKESIDSYIDKTIRRIEQHRSDVDYTSLTSTLVQILIKK